MQSLQRQHSQQLILCYSPTFSSHEERGLDDESSMLYCILTTAE